MEIKMAKQTYIFEKETLREAINKIVEDYGKAEIVRILFLGNKTKITVNPIKNEEMEI